MDHATAALTGRRRVLWAERAVRTTFPPVGAFDGRGAPPFYREVWNMSRRRIVWGVLLLGAAAVALIVARGCGLV